MAGEPTPAAEAAKTPASQAAKVAEPAQDQRAAALGGKAGTGANSSAGRADDSSGDGIPGAMADYLVRLRAWLERHKEYPRRARTRRQGGIALLYLVMDCDGRVLEHRLQRSSGHAVLDRAVMAMIERAQPLPKMPGGMHRSRLELAVPVQFLLR